MTKRKLIYFAILLSGLLAMESCVREAVPETHRDSQEAPEGKVKLKFSVAVPTLEASLATKAETRDSLPNIETMHVAVFGGSGFLKEYTEATLVSKARTNYYGSAADIYQYEAMLSLTNSSIKVHFFGNYEGELSFDNEANIVPTLYKTTSDAYTDGYWQRKLVPNGIQAMKYNGISFDNSYEDPVTGNTVTVHREGSTFYDDNGLLVEADDFINAAGNKITNGEGYIVATETVEALSNIQLIRNFAKISVESTYHNFELLSYAVINTPVEGTLAPYEREWIDYLSYSESVHTGDPDYDAYEALRADYPGAEVPSPTYDMVLPQDLYFRNPSSAEPRVKGIDPNTGKCYPTYIYERRAPSDQNDIPTVIIVYGNYLTRDAEDNVTNRTPCYYKIDLMEKGEYLTIYRNFQYNITIKSILKPGKSTAKQAYEGAGSGDISSDINAATLTDISDGTVRLYVLETAPVLVGQQDDYEIQFKFVTNVSTGDASVNNYVEDDSQDPWCITITGGDGTGNVIEDYWLDDNAGDAETGYYRTIHFKTKDPTGYTQKETIRITGTFTTGSGETAVVHKLYRDVEFTLLNVQTLWVKCIPREVEKGTGRNVTVRVTIPTGLPRSMFPLQFALEPAAKSIDPRYDVEQNLPVQHGQTYQYTETVSGTDSTRTRKSDNSYFFIRELTYDEYSAAGSEVAGTMYFDSFFKTIKEDSASEVYVGCLRPVDVNGDEKSYDYFKPGKDAFSDYTKRNFNWENTPDYWVAGTESQAVTFSVNTADVQDVYITLTGGLAPASAGSGLSGTGTPDVYKVNAGDIQANGQVTIRVSVPDLKGYDVGIGLSAYHYNDASLSGTIGEWVTVDETHTGETATLSTTGRTSGSSGMISWTSANCTQNNAYLQLNNNGSITISNTNTDARNFEITRVVFTFYRGNRTTYYGNAITVNNYTENTSYAVSGNNQQTGTWNGRAGSGFNFSFTPQNTYTRITQMVVTYSYTATETIFDTSRD